MTEIDAGARAPITEPIPREQRHLDGIDVGVLWANMGISLLGIVAGAGLVAYGLGLAESLLAIAIGGVIGALLLSAAGYLGAFTGQPGMVTLRRSLGLRGSYIPTVINVLQGFGWGTFEILVIAEAARVAAGVDERWPFVLAAGALATTLAVMGPEFVIRRILRKIITPLVAVAMLYLLLRLALGEDTSGLGLAAASGIGLMAAIDLVTANSASWMPLVPDYTRFARSPRSAALGVGIGFLLAGTVTFAVGALAASRTGEIASAEGGVAVMLAIPFGLVVAIILILDETEKGFANVYSTAVSLRNFAPRAPQAPLAIAVGVIVTIGALSVTLDRFFDYLYLLGSLFVPLFGAVFADRLRTPRPIATVVAWLTGFLTYQWLNPTGVFGIADWVATPFGGMLGATIPAFLVAGAVRLLWPGRRGAPTGPGRDEAT
jgi:NCS1 family nucleobase:cation symporter-1